MKDLITVVIPIYNVEKYLERCIKSIIKQTYKNILETWTIRDVKKFNKAKENNLNYLAFYTEKEMIKWIENELKNN